MAGKPTEEDFLEFKQACKKWIDYWGLWEWCVYYEFTDTDKAQGNCSVEMESHTAVLRLSNSAIYRPAALIAKHEVLELLTASLRIKALEGSKADFLEEHHRLIRRLENIISDGRSAKTGKCPENRSSTGRGMPGLIRHKEGVTHVA